MDNTENYFNIMKVVKNIVTNETKCRNSKGKNKQNKV